MGESKRTEAKERLRGKGQLEHKLIEIAHGRRWGSRPILVPLHRALEAVREAKKAIGEWLEDFPTQDEKHYDGNWNPITWEKAVEIHQREGKQLFERWFGK